MNPDTKDDLYRHLFELSDIGWNYSSDSNMSKWLNFLATFFLRLRGNLDEIYKAISIDEAKGEELDNIGDEIQQPRYGVDDDEYKFILKTQIIVSRSTGTVNDIINIVANSLEIDPKESGLIVKNDYVYDGSKVSGEPQVVDVTGLPTEYLNNNNQLKVLINRMSSATAAGVVIKATEFINSAIASEYAGVATFAQRERTIQVNNGGN
ncbi:hypothetical protein [Lactobacillus kunkeei] [Lactiplantibacillus mudanjiangensis]|nr:hypothetical protein [Lactobacillus kunkeei] [Lactiplantibacillus mudanjiangensis]